MWMEEDNISNISCYKVHDYFSIVILFKCKPQCSGVLLSICRPGPGLSAVAIANCRAAGDTYAKGTV